MDADLKDFVDDVFVSLRRRCRQTFGQGFYGWIGDVRITGKALETREFLTAR